MQQDVGGSGGGDGNSMHLLLSILADGEEQARRLLGELPPADDEGQLLGRGPAAECCRGVAGQLLCTFAKAIAVAKAIEAAGGDSPRSADEGTGAGMAGRDAAQEQERQGQGVCKRRKGLPRWTEKFRIPDDANLEYTPEDGFSWRKYGQKDILGAKFPRGYYRCTYRNAQGCAATRQVQRSDADLAVFDVTYQGAHTCLQAQRRAAAPPPPPPASHDGGVQQQAPAMLQDPDMQLLENFRNGLKVETDGLPPPQPSFYGHSHDAFSLPYTAAAGYSASGQQQLQGGGCFSSPAATTSAGPGYFSVSSAAHCALGTHGSPELAEVVSAATASDPAGFDYSLYQYHDLQQHDLDAHLLPFPFDPMFGHPSASHGRHGDA